MFSFLRYKRYSIKQHASIGKSVFLILFSKILSLRIFQNVLKNFLVIKNTSCNDKKTKKVQISTILINMAKKRKTKNYVNRNKIHYYFT